MKYESYLLTLYFVFVFKWYRGILNIFCGFFSSFYQLFIQQMCSPTHFGQMYYTQKSCVTKIQKFAPGFFRGHCTLQRNAVLQFDCVEFKQDKSCLNSTQSNFCNLLQKNFKESYKQNFSGQAR